MKAYQVFEGEYEEMGDYTHFELVATYLNKERALEHCRKLAEEYPLCGDQLIESDFNEKYGIKDWDVRGWDIVTIVRFKEIDITE